MDKELLEKIESAIDEAMVAFKADEESIFNNEKDRLKYKYETLKKVSNWKKGKKCVVHYCDNKSIERSHTIQKSGSLKEISEDGHVLMPRFNIDTGEMEISKIGVNEASTFPGYCLHHEKLFTEFENLKDFEVGSHMGLQLYRTICREIVMNQNHIDHLNHLEFNYKEYRDKKIGEAINNNLGYEVMQDPELSFKRTQVTYQDRKLHTLKIHRKRVEKYLNDFLYPIRDALLNDLSKKRFQKIAYEAVLFDRVIPAALAGRGNFNIKLKTKWKSVEVILNVLPLEKKTYIFAATFKKHSKELKAYVNHFKNPLQMVSMIETWMIHGSDHWFIRPSVWGKIQGGFKQEILEKILDEKCNIGHEIDLTIFNDIKKESIKLMEENYSQLNQQLVELLQIEKEKLTC